MPFVPGSIIVLNHNTRDLTLSCLHNFVAKLRAVGWEVIVVDNGSTDGSEQAIREAFADVKVIRSERNLGFAGGNNLGLCEAQGAVVILINSDVLAPAETLRDLADSLLAQPTTGAISAGLMTPEGRPQAFAFGADPTVGYLLRRAAYALLGLGAMHEWDIAQPVQVDWVSGACLAVRREVVQQVGLLDENFFLYFEDNDWCLRMRQAGWRVIYEPRLRVTHLGGVSQPQRRVANQYYYQGLVRFYRKHYGCGPALLLRLVLGPYQLLARLRWSGR